MSAAPEVMIVSRCVLTHMAASAVNVIPDLYLRKIGRLAKVLFLYTYLV